MKHSKKKKNWTKKRKRQNKSKTKKKERKTKKERGRERKRLPSQPIVFFPQDFSHVVYLALYQNI